eukprot:TRINITY_DN1273_c0_g1_i1.p1 TRINITY_DN1273_c0_g1~~TRINITY_DN1273_c0_g1_i1.p1  ORF type:complete len:324 (-),score=74.18 TRINITY_DN1273_c0_g1_i1:17-988(-)
MKRGALCAAAQEDGDSSDENSMVVKPPSKKKPKVLLKKAADVSRSADSAEATNDRQEGRRESSSSEPKKKEKEFAWMDSDEDDDKEEAKATGSSDAKRQEKGDRSGSEDENADVTASTMDSVETFGRMMVLAPALLKKIPRMMPEDVAAACRALARTKFFDGDVIRVLHSSLRRLLQRDRLTVEQTHDVLTCLGSLNAYDQGVFREAARVMKVKTSNIDLVVRQTWLEIYKAFKHSGDADFYQLLEVPHMTALNPGYKRLRCAHFTRGHCAVGENCSWAHDMRAPVEMENAYIKPVSKVMMTQTQSNMGKHIYGGARNGQVGV